MNSSVPHARPAPQVSAVSQIKEQTPSLRPDPEPLATHWRCAACGHTFSPAAFAAHRNAFPPNHPLHRCLDLMELQALEYERGASGAWALGTATNTHPSQARRLATLRQEFEHWQATGEVLPHERLVPGARTIVGAVTIGEPALVPEVRAAVPTAVRPAVAPADAAEKARKREQTRLRVRRYRAKHGGPTSAAPPIPVTHPPTDTGSVTCGARPPPGAATVANLGQFSTRSGGSGRVHR